MLDPETKGLVKLGLLEKRLVENGKLDPKDATIFRVASADTGASEAIKLAAIGVGYIGIVALLLLAGALGGLVVRQALLFEVGGLQLYVPVGLSIACFALGIAFWLYRDLRRAWQVAMVQVIVAVAAGVAAVIAAPDYFSKGVALAAAAVAVADGIEKIATALKQSAAQRASP